MFGRLWSLRRGGIVLGVTALASLMLLVAAACGGGGEEGGTATPTAAPTETVAPTETPAGGAEFTIVGKNIAFDVTELRVAAGSTVTITFDHQDAGVPHNIAFYTDSSASEPLTPDSATEIENGPVTQTLTFTAPEQPGEYFYRCDVHPTEMTGTLVVE